ncbi:MAG TPA: acetyltransferase [Ignavibacteria bacterium]|nr:acetyltransferase [Ignavibacteria bacterium]HRA98967.1 acetyltransferase [Ignavibacteria bacterium]
MKNKKLIIIGNTSNARLAKYFFDIDSDYEPIAFSVDKKYITESEFERLPVTAFEDLEKEYPPTEYEAFVAVGYTNMNKIREDLYNKCKEKGYRMANYISTRCSFLTQFPTGDNCFILEDNTIQPFVKIGNNVVLWSGNHIGHDVTIEDHNFITSHVVVSGFVTIKRNCFIGVNATIRDDITIAPETLIAAGAIIMKDTEEKGVYLPARSVLFEKKSDEIKIS